MSALLALLSSVLWGGADFLGGTASRRAPVRSVLLLSQLTALLGLVPVAAATGELDADRAYLLPALAAGLTGLVGLAAFYRALSTGTMGVVAPVASLGVVVPLVTGLVTGEVPSGPQLAGIALAVAGVVLSCGPELHGGARQATPLLLALVAAASFGTVLVLLAGVSGSSIVMTLLTMRLTSVVVLTVLLLTGLRAGGSGVALGVDRSLLPLIALAGTGDVLANGSFSLAVGRAGALVSVTGVLASLYPVVTVLLARTVHDERLGSAQLVGVTGALAGVVLIAAG